MRGYVGRHWRGEASLGRSFWLGYVLLGLAAGAGLRFLQPAEDSSVLADLGWMWLPMPFLIALSVWQVVGVWRSARRTIQQRRRWLWPRLAQGCMIVGVLLTLLGTAVQAAASVQLLQIYFDPMLSDFALIADEARGTAIFRGALSDRAGDRLVAVVEDGRFPILRIDSHGGLVTPAKRVARKIRQHGTKVVVEGECSSACVFLLAASKFGAIRPDSNIILHQLQPVVSLLPATYRTDPSAASRTEMQKTGEDLFAELGVKPAIYRPVRSRTYWQPTLRQMSDGRLIAFIIDPDSGLQVPAYVWCLGHAEACDAPRWMPEE